VSLMMLGDLTPTDAAFWLQSFGTAPPLLAQLGLSLLSGLFWMTLVVYLDHVSPAASDSPYKKDFFMNPSFWSPSAPTVDPSVPVVRMDNVVKVYDANKKKRKAKAKAKSDDDDGEGRVMALDGLSFGLDSNRVVGILGHNGAGKTTAMRILGGALCPTSGSAIVAGLDAGREPWAIRKSVGMCPQENLAMDKVTVEEQVMLFASIARPELSVEERTNLAVSMLSEIGLGTSRDRNKYTTVLSGGMKRKMMIAIACLSSPPIIMLDEPTSGMDVDGRRRVWKLLQQRKQNSLVVLTTHS
ncbi:ABC transporter A, ABCA, partial [Kipferlia bialata]